MDGCLLCCKVPRLKSSLNPATDSEELSNTEASRQLAGLGASRTRVAVLPCVAHSGIFCSNRAMVQSRASVTSCRRSFLPALAGCALGQVSAPLKASVLPSVPCVLQDPQPQGKGGQGGWGPVRRKHRTGRSGSWNRDWPRVSPQKGASSYCAIIQPPPLEGREKCSHIKAHVKVTMKSQMRGALES